MTSRPRLGDRFRRRPASSGRPSRPPWPADAPAPRHAVLLLALPARADDPAGGLFALCVGVSTTADPKGDPELAADRDALRLAEALRKGPRFRQATALVAGDGGAGRATAAALRRHLQRFAADAGPADVVVFHFSGYEMQYPADDGHFLCPADGRRSDRGSLVPLADVYAALKESKAGAKLVVIDSCRGRAGLRRNPAGAPADPPAGVATVWACSAGELAMDTPGAGGVFTNALVGGLGGPADADRVPADGRQVLSPDTRRPHQQTPSVQGRTGPVRLPVAK